MATIRSHFKKGENVKNRNSTVASVVSVASGDVDDPTLATLAMVLFAKTHLDINYQNGIISFW